MIFQLKRRNFTSNNIVPLNYYVILILFDLTFLTGTTSIRSELNLNQKDYGKYIIFSALMKTTQRKSI